MARKAQIEKQMRRELRVSRNAERRAALKKIISDQTVDFDEKEAAMIQLNKMSPDTSRVRLRNRCQFTGRGRGYLRKFQMSRICFREMANQGLIPGVFKASW